MSDYTLVFLKMFPNGRVVVDGSDGVTSGCLVGRDELMAQMSALYNAHCLCLEDIANQKGAS